mmetsp:Transcript_98363/g.194991  ORF Transcript_98363/g.194991 Transcript_98363/m.194991 type:complete len:149 (-) Transcript_98363:198-644(-)
MSGHLVESTLGEKWCRVVSDASTLSPREAVWQRQLSNSSDDSTCTGSETTSSDDNLPMTPGKEDSSAAQGGLLAKAACAMLVIGVIIAWIFLPAVALAGLSLSAVLVLNVASFAVGSCNKEDAVIAGFFLPLGAFSAVALLAPLAPPV